MSISMMPQAMAQMPSTKSEATTSSAGKESTGTLAELFMAHLATLMPVEEGAIEGQALPQEGDLLPLDPDELVDLPAIMALTPELDEEDFAELLAGNELPAEIVSKLPAMINTLGETSLNKLAIPKSTSNSSVTDTAKPISKTVMQAMLLQSNLAVGSEVITAATQEASGLPVKNLLDNFAGQLSQSSSTISSVTSPTIAPLAGTSFNETRMEGLSQAVRPQTVDVPVAKQGWDQAVGKQLVWQATQQIQSAEIRLNPAHLGPMEVRISIEGEQANVVFTSQHAMVREALEAAIPRLRDMLSESGLSLANVDVSQQGFSGKEGDKSQQTQASDQMLSQEQGEDNSEDSSATSQRVNDLNLVDYYA